MTMALTSQIPPEIYGLITHYISDKSTIQNLCLSSKATRSEAERVLYRKISLYGIWSNIFFLKTITQNKRLASMVKEYRWHIMWGSESPTWRLLASGLQNMVNLKVLDFTSTLNTPCGELILHAPFQLEKLIWRCRSDDAVLEKVLVEQQSLKFLYLREYTMDAKWCISADACPNLHTFVGNSYAIADILGHGRRIKEVGWEQRLQDLFSTSVNSFLTQNQAKGFSSVKLLTFGPCRNRPSLRDIGAHNLQRLEVLQLFGWYPEEELVINELYSLRELVISQIHKTGSGVLKHNLTFVQCEALTARLFESCTNLSQVDISHPASAGGHGHYRWKRNSPGKEHLKESEVQSRFIHLSFRLDVLQAV